MRFKTDVAYELRLVVLFQLWWCGYLQVFVTPEVQLATSQVHLHISCTRSLRVQLRSVLFLFFYSNTNKPFFCFSRYHCPLVRQRPPTPTPPHIYGMYRFNHPKVRLLASSPSSLADPSTGDVRFALASPPPRTRGPHWRCHSRAGSRPSTRRRLRLSRAGLYRPASAPPSSRTQLYSLSTMMERRWEAAEYIKVRG
jgi:hypothetical protein